MVATIKTYALVYICLVLLVLGAPNKLAYTAPQYKESIDSRLIFNSTVVEQIKEFDSTLSRINAKKDTVIRLTEEIKQVAKKAKTNEPKVLAVDSEWGIVPITYSATNKRLQE